LHKLQQIFERTTVNLDDVQFEERGISADNNQYTFLLHILATIIGKRGGNTIKKITLRKCFLDENNLKPIFSCNMLCLNIIMINDDADR